MKFKQIARLSIWILSILVLSAGFFFLIRGDTSGLTVILISQAIFFSSSWWSENRRCKKLRITGDRRKES